VCGEGVAAAGAAATAEVQAWDEMHGRERGLKGFYFIYYRYVFFFFNQLPLPYAIINLSDLRARTIKHPGKVPFYKCPRTNLI